MNIFDECVESKCPMRHEVQTGVHCCSKVLSVKTHLHQTPLKELSSHTGVSNQADQS